MSNYLLEKELLFFEFQNGSRMAGVNYIYHFDFVNKMFFQYLEKRNGTKTDYKKIILSDNEIKMFQEKIKFLNLDSWEERYINRIIRDGHQWKIIYQDEKKERKIIGSNAYPSNWNHLTDIIKIVQEKINNFDET